VDTLFFRLMPLSPPASSRNFSERLFCRTERSAISSANISGFFVILLEWIDGRVFLSDQNMNFSPTKYAPLPFVRPNGSRRVQRTSASVGVSAKVMGVGTYTFSTCSTAGA